MLIKVSNFLSNSFLLTIPTDLFPFYLNHHHGFLTRLPSTSFQLQMLLILAIYYLVDGVILSKYSLVVSIFWLKVFHSCFLRFLRRACKAFINLISLNIFDFFQHWPLTQHVLTILKSVTYRASWSFLFPNVVSHTLLTAPPYLSILWLKKEKNLCKTIKPWSF